MIWTKVVSRETTPLTISMFYDQYRTTVDRCRRETNIIFPDKLRIDNALHIDQTTHLDATETMPFFQAQIRFFMKEDTKLFLGLGEKIKAKAEEILSFVEKINKATLGEMSRKELLRLIEEFQSRYYDYLELAVLPPIAVDVLYKTKSEEFVHTISEKIARKFSENIEQKSASLAKFCSESMSQDSISKQIKSKIIRILNTTFEKCFADKRDLSLYQIATRINENEMAKKLFTDASLSEEKLKKNLPQIYQSLKEVLTEFKWLKRFSFPPFGSFYSFQDFIAEVRSKLEENPKEVLKARENERMKGRELLETLSDSGFVSNYEKDFMETVQLFSFLRAWRMEVNMKIQYLIQPLFKEIENRAMSDKKLRNEDDIFFMTIQEIRDFLITNTVPKDIDSRRKDYAIFMKDGKLRVISGDELSQFKREFYSVINCKENGRGTHAHESEFVGGKGENLFKLLDNKFNVPTFFVITAEAFKDFLIKNSLSQPLLEIIKKGDYDEEHIQRLFLNATMPSYIEKAILQQFELNNMEKVIVRSSATVEDSEKYSWAGRFDSYPYVRHGELLDKVKLVWASLFNKRAFLYATEKNIDLLKSSMAVITQEMIDPDFSGVANTAISTKAEDIMEIEIGYGQGSPIVSGEITPDRCFINKKNTEIIEKQIGIQKKKFTAGVWKNIDTKYWEVQKVSNKKIQELANLFTNIEKIYEHPQDIEFSLKDGTIIVLQSRPHTGLDTIISKKRIGKVKGKLILTGMRGRVEARIKGIARVLERPTEIDKINKGEILVIEAATPQWDQVIFKATGLITNEGGATCHAIRVSNERGIPVVVGTGFATERIRNGEVVTIDTTDMFKGKIHKEK